MTPLEHPPSCRTTPSPSRVPDGLPRTKAGTVKRRLTWEENLRILDPNSSIEETEKRIDKFAELFAYRHADGIITRVGQGPRAWTALREPIYHDYIVRHLLADRVSTLPPQCIGARSYNSTRFTCIDVDADRSRDSQIESYGLSHLDEADRESFRAWLLQHVKPPKAKPPFEDRCRYVEEVLRWVGIDPEDPQQVLIQVTPSEGDTTTSFSAPPTHWRSRSSS